MHTYIICTVTSPASSVIALWVFIRAYVLLICQSCHAEVGKQPLDTLLNIDPWWRSFSVIEREQANRIESCQLNVVRGSKHHPLDQLIFSNRIHFLTQFLFVSRENQKTLTSGNSNNFWVTSQICSLTMLAAFPKSLQRGIPLDLDSTPLFSVGSINGISNMKFIQNIFSSNKLTGRIMKHHIEHSTNHKVNYSINLHRTL